MSRKLSKGINAPATMPRGTVADHWTWHDGVPHVTGWHDKPKRGQQQVEPLPAPVVSRGLVTTSTRRGRSSALKDRQGKLL